MKGIIIDYLEEKGFGFILDENEEKRFFHISKIREKDQFLNKITDYLYTDWVERNCYVVDFQPGETEKGLNASNIHLTDQIFNDKSIKVEFQAKIVGIRYDTATLTRSISGIKKGMSRPFGTTAGSNGTYRLGYPETIRELNVRLRRIDDIGWETIDIRNLALRINQRDMITSKFVENLKDQLIGKTIPIVSDRGEWNLLNHSIFKI